MDEANTSPPPMRTPQKAPSIWFWLSAVTVVGTYLITFILLIFVVPVFMQMFADFGAESPKPTQIMISLSGFMKSYFIFLQFPAAAVMALFIWGLYELDKHGQRAIVILVGVVLPIIPLVITLAMFLPIFQLNSVVK